MKNLTTILSLAALAACSNNNTTTTAEPGEPIAPEEPTTEVTQVVDLASDAISTLGTNQVTAGDLFLYEDSVILPPNTSTVIILDAELFEVSEGSSLDLLLTAPEGEFLIEYRFPFVGGVELTDWASLRPDSFRAWASTTSVGFTRDSIAPSIDYDLPTDSEAVTGLIEPGTGAGDAILDTVETDAVRATIELIVTNLDDSPAVVALTAIGIGG